MRCLDDTQVLEYLGERVPAATIRAIREHLDTCAECVSLVAALADSGHQPTVPADGGTRRSRPLPAVDPADYEIGDTIARGGMGRILAATDRRLDRPIAIKELLVETDQLRARFEREVRITAKLQHPSIVNVLEAGVWPGGEPFFAMKRVVGESLAKRLRKVDSLDERLGLLPNVIALGDALAYAHEQRIIHRDLKPDNVLLGDYGETVVIDWGLAKQLDEAPDAGASIELAKGTPPAPGGTVAGAVLGTPAYMPPEQALGEPVDERADVYALGAILYEVLSGRPPYRGPSAQAVLAEVVSTAPPPLREIVPGLARDLGTIVEKAMARAPEERYRTATPFAEDLRRFQTGQLVASHHYSVGQRFARWLRRHRTAVVIATMALGIITAVAMISARDILDARARADAQRELAETSRAQAEASRGDAEDLIDFMLGDLRHRLEPIGKVEMLGAVAKKARDYYAHRPPAETAADMRRHILARVNLGSVLSVEGDTDGALGEFRAAVALATQLAARDPTDPKNLDALLRSRLKLGSLLAMRGDSAEAGTGFQAVVELAERRLAIAPADLDTLFAAEDGNLRLGDVLRGQGDIAGALVHAQRALGFARKQVELDPGNARWKSGLSLALRENAEIYRQKGDPKSATPYVREAADVSEGLLAKDPTNAALQMDVVRTREKIVDLYEEQGDLDAALAAVKVLRATALERLEHDPADATRGFDAAMVHRRVGKVYLTRKEYPQALAELREARTMAEGLMARDPSNRLWQNDLSYIDSDLGRTLEAAHQLAQALPAYVASRDLRAKLAAADPHSLTIKNDLALSHELVANTLRDLGKLDASISEFTTCVALARELAVARHDDEDSRRNLMGLLAHLGEAQARAHLRREAIANYEESLALANKLEAAKPKMYADDIAAIREALASLHR